MLSNNKLKYLRSLHQRKFRQKYHNFIAEGEKIGQEVLHARPGLVETICALPGWLDENRALVSGSNAETIEVAPAELKKISLLHTPNQVLMVLRQPGQAFDDQKIKAGFSLYLDGIRDPGNLGTILRIADWFGINHVFRSANSVDVFNPKVVQASMGAFIRVASPSIDFFDLKKRLDGIPVFGAVLDGVPVFKMALPEACLLVIGNESRGISPEITSALTEKISIPKHREGGAESLNAAIATGILCSAFRQ